MTKYINLDNIDNINRFDKKIVLYKSFLYKFCEFKLENENQEYKDIIYALNIKNRKQRIKYIYEYCCDLIDNYNRENNIICEFDHNKCKDCKHNWHINGCCWHCKLQNQNGCPTANLACKLFFCEYMDKKYNLLKFEDIKMLKLLTKTEQYIVKHNVFTHKQTFLRLLYIGSYLVFSFYSIFKLFTMKNISKK